MKTVYWSKYNFQTESNDLLWQLSPNQLYQYSKNNFSANLNDSLNWLKCPASVDIMSKTWFIENQLDININIKKDEVVYSDTIYSKNILNFRNFDDNYVILDYLISLNMFCESDLNISVFNPYIYPAKNLFAVPGKFNISKWFRPINPSFMAEIGKDISFKKGDPLLYFSFDTNEKINFKEFYFSDTLKEISKELMLYKKYSKKNSLNSLYSAFSDKKINKIVLKEIKKMVI